MKLGRIALLLVSAVSLMLSASADEVVIPVDKLPKAVVDAVKGKFPKAEFVKAEQEDDIFEIVIKSEGREYELGVSKDGKIVEIEHNLKTEELPKKLADAITTRFPKSTIKEVEEVTKFDKDGKGTITYDVKIETSDKKILVVKCDENGIKEVEKEKPEARDPKRLPFIGIVFDGTSGKVKDVFPKCPASEAGVKPEDIVKQFGDTKIDSVKAFFEAFIAKKPGDKVKLVVERDGKEVTLEVKLTERPKELDQGEQGERGEKGEKNEVGENGRD